MNTKTNGQPSKKPKLLLVLPLIALPFLALIFWALRGGHSRDDTDITTAGLNISLPDAHLPDDSAMDKMSFYEQEEKAVGKSGENSFDRDSVNLAGDSDTDFERALSEPDPYDYYKYTNEGNNKSSSGGTASKSEKDIRLKLKQLQENLYQSEKDGASISSGKQQSYLETTSGVEMLSQMIADNQKEDAPDPEMEQLQGMINRIYDIQHPNEVNTKLQQQSEKARGIVFPVSTALQPNAIHLLTREALLSDTNSSTMVSINGNGFWGLVSKESQYQTLDKGIAAVIQENTTVINGATVKIRLLQEVYINGIAIPAGNFLTGQAQLSNDRITIDINSILYNQYLFQVKLSAFDTDGMQGLYVPNAISREVIKQSGDNAIQSFGIASLDPSIGAQAAAAGIETAKTLFSRKLKLTKVFIKAGHRLVLKDNQQ